MTFEVALILVIVGILFGIVAGLALLGFFAKMGAFVAIGSYLGLQKDERDAIWNRWEVLATEHGWTPKAVEHALEGELGGVQLRVGRLKQRIIGWSGDQHTRVRATQIQALRHLRFVLRRETSTESNDASSTSGFTAAAVEAVAKGSPAPALTTLLLRDSAVRRWLDSTEALDWQDGVVTCRFAGLDPDALSDRVALAVAQVDALVGALDRLAHALAGHTGLSLVPDPDRVLPRLTGQLEGVAVDVYQVDQTDVMKIIATLPVPVEGLRILVNEAQSAPGIRLGDPVLDGMVTVTAADPELARNRIVQDATREFLLVVLKGYPGSTVDGLRVVVACPTVEPEAVALATTSAVTLARLLSGGSESQPGSAIVAQARSEQSTV